VTDANVLPCEAPFCISARLQVPILSALTKARRAGYAQFVCAAQFKESLDALLHADLPGDTRALFERRRRRLQREAIGHAASFPFVRIPLVDPDRLLDALRPILGLAFTWPAAIAWAVLLILTGGAIATNWPDALAQSRSLLTAENLPFTYAAFIIAKLLHELSHGVAAKHFARREDTRAEVRTMGVMLLVLVPYPYVDASAAWALRSKWRRAAIGAAGMYAELALAAVAAIVWANTTPGAVNALAFNVIAIASVATVLFNANPLLRYDGYYILSDLTETPNLAQRARDLLHHLVKRYAWGVRTSHAPTRSTTEGVLFAVYAIAAGLYRIVLGVFIVLLVVDMFFIVGVLMAIAVAIIFFGVPIGKLIRFLATDQDLDFHRARAVLTTLIAVAGVGALVGGVPMPRSVRTVGVVEPASRVDVYIAEPGFIDAVHADHETIAAGAVVYRASNPALTADLAAAESRLVEADLTLNAAIATDPAVANIRREQLDVRRTQLDALRAREAALAPTAPIGGVWIPADRHPPIGRFLERGADLGTIADLSTLRVRAPLAEDDATLVIAEGRPTCSLRPFADPATTIDRPTPDPQPLSAPPASIDGGGRPVDGFELVIPLDDAAGALSPGQRVAIRVPLAPQTLAQRARNAIRALIDRPER